MPNFLGRIGWFIFWPILAANLVGCTAAYNARTVNSPDWKYSATCYIRGGFGRSYIAETKKKIVVSVYEFESGMKEFKEKEMKDARTSGVWVSHPGTGPTVTQIFQKKYSFKASSLTWTSAWGTNGDFSVTFYDYGRNVESSYSKNETPPKRIIRTMHYSFDPTFATYSEVDSK